MKNISSPCAQCMIEGLACDPRRKSTLEERIRVKFRRFAITIKGDIELVGDKPGAAGSIFATSLEKAYLRVKSRQR